MDTTTLFVDAFSPVTCLGLLQGWTHTYDGGCARQIMARDAVDVLLPSRLQYSGLKKGRLFRIKGSEFLAEVLEDPAAVAKLNGMVVPPGFILYFQEMIGRFCAIPFSILDLLENTAEDIYADVSAVYATYKERHNTLSLGAALSPIEKPSVVYLMTGSKIWEEFWDKAVKYRVRRRSGNTSLLPLVGCTRVLDVDPVKIGEVCTTEFKMDSPEVFFRQCGAAVAMSAEQWIITHRDAFLLLLILTQTTDNISQLLNLPYGKLKL